MMLLGTSAIVVHVLRHTRARRGIWLQDTDGWEAEPPGGGAGAAWSGAAAGPAVGSGEGRSAAGVSAGGVAGGDGVTVPDGATWPSPGVATSGLCSPVKTETKIFLTRGNGSILSVLQHFFKIIKLEGISIFYLGNY